MHHRLRQITVSLLSLVGLVFSGCATVASPLPEIKAEQTYVRNDTPIRAQVSNLIEDGLALDLDSFQINIPSKQGADNLIDLSHSQAHFRLDAPSLHGIVLSLAASGTYNGAADPLHFNLDLPGDDTIYLALGLPQRQGKQRGFRFKSDLAIVDAPEGMDEGTRGITYFEYGALDHFLYSSLEALGISFSLSTSEGGIAFDGAAIKDSLAQMEAVGSDRFIWNLPLGEATLPLGLVASSGTLRRIEFPADGGTYTFENGIECSFSATIRPDENHVFSAPNEAESYVEISDSLELVKGIGRYVKSKSFGFDGEFTIAHAEGSITGDDTHFAREGFSEEATLSFTGDADFSVSPYQDAAFSLSLSQGSDSENLALHLREEEGETRAYLNLNDILKAKTNVSTVSSFATSLKNALGDETIRNETIMALLSGLLSTADSIQQALDAIQGTGLYSSIKDGHYEESLEIIKEISHDQNSIRVQIDLAPIAMSGNVTITLSSAADSLLSIALDQVGIATSEEPTLNLAITGTLAIRDFLAPALETDQYVEMEHLPAWEEELSAIAETDQLTADIEGYVLQLGTTAVANQTVHGFSGNRLAREQGFLFSGNLGFDLAEKKGTGKATFTDRKENFLNDHNLKLDVTGPEIEDTVLSDEAKRNNDYTGNDTPNGGMMLFEYDSKNSATTKSAYSKATEPKHDSLKGRFSVHSLDTILGIVTDLMSSDDVRFDRLTSLFSDLTTKSTIGALLGGKYLQVLASGILSSVSIDNLQNIDTFVLKPGLIKEGYPLTLRITYEDDAILESGVHQGKPKILEVLSRPENSAEGTEIYAKITLTGTNLESADFNWGASPNLNDFRSYSSLAHLLDYLLGTITLGSTDTNPLTTYHLSGRIPLKILTKTYNIELEIFIYLHGTNVKIIGSVHTPEIKPIGLVSVTNADTYVNLFYESNGEDKEGDLFLTRRHVEDHDLSNDKKTEEFRRVRGKDFSANLLDWLLGFILNVSGQTNHARRRPHPRLVHRRHLCQPHLDHHHRDGRAHPHLLIRRPDFDHRRQDRHL